MTQKKKMINRNLILVILFVFFGCSNKLTLSYKIENDSLIINDRDSFGLYYARNFIPIIITSDNNLFIYDGNFFVVKYENGTFTDTLRLPYNSKIKPKFKELDNNYLIFTIGLEQTIISKDDLNKTFEPYKVICGQFEEQGFDTYNFYIENIKIEGDLVVCVLEGNVKDKLIELLWKK